jgi:uncharacterized membrane protein (DUF106 family)
MKTLKKLAILFVLTLIMISAVSIIAGSVKAQETLSVDASVSTNNPSVSQDATYTFMITNVGQATLGDANITIPIGYSKVRNLAISQQPTSENWNLSLQEGFIVLYGSSQGLSTGQGITFTFDALNPQVAGTYTWRLGANESTSADGLNAPAVTIGVNNSVLITSILPALAILAVAAGITFLNSGIYRVLINRFIGWEQYHIMQKELAEYRSESMAAARANDKKQMERLKKKKSQIDNMQAKMFKPQIAQFGTIFVNLAIWYVILIPTFGNTSMAYLPGFGPLPVFWWYPIGSFFLGLLSQRIIGITPIEPR